MAEFAGTERFEVKRRMGAGGMGVVYEAFDRERRARVALKTLRELDEHSLWRFKNEFRALADLRHPNLVRLGELYCEQGQWFFSMELIEGTSFLSYVWLGRAEPAAAAAGSTADTLTDSRLAARTRMRRFDEVRLRTTL